MPTLRATIRYVGTPFAGWQVQPDRPTVQGEIQKALSQIASTPIRIYGAGRTDAGVHAFGQVCSFQWDAGGDLDKLRRSLTRMLAPYIQVTALHFAPDGFHAGDSAIGKRYWYCVSTADEPDPFIVAYCWQLPRGVDLNRLRELTARFTGTRDFAGFQSSGSERQTTVRRLNSIEIAEGGIVSAFDAKGLYTIRFHGDGFLYKMVRNITGTLVDVARGVVHESRIEELFESGGPYRGYTAPAHGLTLVEVIYPQ